MKVKNSTYVWPYNIICGICNEEMLRADALTACRISYFKTRHNKCTAELRKSEKDKRQLSIFDTMRGTQMQAPKRKIRVADSDREISDEEKGENSK